MRFSGFFFMAIVAVLVLNAFFPYWVVMIVLALLAALVRARSGAAFFAGGLAMGLAWLGHSIFITYSTGSDLSNNLAEIMGLSSGLFLFGITALVGFLLGAFSAWTGSLLAGLTKRKPDNIYRG